MDSISRISGCICIAVCLLHTASSQNTAFYSRGGHEHTKLGDDFYKYVHPLINSIQVNCELNLKRMEERMEEMIDSQQDRMEEMVNEKISSLEKAMVAIGQLRLVTSATTQPNLAENAVSGRLEIYLKGQWGTVCDDEFEDVDASVACKYLGGVYNGTGKVVPHSATTDGTGPIWLESIECTGSEASLLQCSHRGIGVHDCTHPEDVGVKCYKK